MGRQVYSGGQLVQDWDDPTRTYSRFIAGHLVEQRPYTEAEAANLVRAAQGGILDGNRASITGAVGLALLANNNDVTQDQTVRDAAIVIRDNPATTLTAAQMVTVLKQLAAGIAVLAGNDLNTKRELNALIRLAVGALDTTAGT